jgi:hypothetical protein
MERDKRESGEVRSKEKCLIALMRNEAENVALMICTIKQLCSDTNKYCFWIVWKYLLFFIFQDEPALRIVCAFWNPRKAQELLL